MCSPPLFRLAGRLEKLPSFAYYERLPLSNFGNADPVSKNPYAGMRVASPGAAIRLFSAGAGGMIPAVTQPGCKSDVVGQIPLKPVDLYER